MQKKILLVDDADLFLEVEKSIFKRTGAAILTARTGKEALTLVAKEKPDIVLLDLGMPDLRGDQICAQIKANPETAWIPVIMVTEFGAVADVEKCRRAGCDSFITKPIRHKDLSAKVAELLKIPHRRSMRILVRLEAHGAKKNDAFFGTSADISKAGIFIETDKELHLEEEITVRFFLPNQEEIVAVGKVARKENRGRNYGYGIRFVNLSDQQEKNLIRFIELKK